MAGLPFPVVYAVAVEVVEQVDTPASVLTRVPAALVHIWREQTRFGCSFYLLISWSHIPPPAP